MGKKDDLPAKEAEAEPEKGEAQDKQTVKPSAEPADDTEEKFDEERAMHTIRVQRDENKALKARLKELEKLEAEDAKRKEAEMTELQKANARAEKAEAEAAKLRLDALRSKVAAATGLPAALAERLQGATEDELTADAKSLLEVLPKKEEPKKEEKKAILKSQITNPGDAAAPTVSDDQWRKILGLKQ